MIIGQAAAFPSTLSVLVPLRLRHTIASLKGVRASLVLALALVAVAPAMAAPPLPRPKPDAPAMPPLPLPKPATRAAPDGTNEPASLSETSGDWPSAAVDKAEARCRKQLAGLNLTHTPLAPLGGPGGCGTPYPLKVSRVGGVEIVPPATMNCAMVEALHRWVSESVQPSAKAAFDEEVAAIRNASSYVCRRRNNRPDGKFSEHAFANALDIMAFRLASGRTVALKDGWGVVDASLGEDGEAAFLRSVSAGACKAFYTVLGPGANDLHRDHFHLDLARGGRYLICE